jgi:hypothetical protein
MYKKTNDESEFLLMPLKILQMLGESIEKGAFLTKSFFVRKEIWNQLNAKIEGLHQKYEAYKTITEKIDNLLILSKNNVIKMENIQKFCDTLIDIQNNFSSDFPCVKSSHFTSKTDFGQNGFYKKFSDISTKLKNNLLSAKLSSKTDYLDVLQKFIKKSKDISKKYLLINLIDSIFESTHIKSLGADIIREKKFQITMFFYTTIIKLLMQDIKDLSTRFLKKKILSFENK